MGCKTVWSTSRYIYIYIFQNKLRRSYVMHEYQIKSFGGEPGYIVDINIRWKPGIESSCNRKAWLISSSIEHRIRIQPYIYSSTNEKTQNKWTAHQHFQIVYITINIHCTTHFSWIIQTKRKKYKFHIGIALHKLHCMQIFKSST